MISFFLISLPTFGVIGVGWAATRTRLVAQGALDALNAFSFRFALPALLLRLIAGQPLRQSFNPEFYTGYLASGAIIFVLVLGTSRIVAARGLSTVGAHATTATVSNLGFLGPPLMLAFFGERGAGPLAMAILAEVMVLLSVGSVLMGANGGPKRGIGSLMQLDAFWVNVGVLIACLPSAGNIYVLAQRHDADPQQVSAAILLSTIVSVVSFPCVAWLALD